MANKVQKFTWVENISGGVDRSGWVFSSWVEVDETETVIRKRGKFLYTEKVEKLHGQPVVKKYRYNMESDFSKFAN